MTHRRPRRNADLRAHGTWQSRALAIGLSLTRIAVLAHWMSDAVAGFALGAALERLLRPWTGYPLKPSKEDNYADSRKSEGAR